MEISAAQYKTILVAPLLEMDYQKIIQRRSTFRSHLNRLIKSYPELFSSKIANSYWLYTTRRIQMTTPKSV